MRRRVESRSMEHRIIGSAVRFFAGGAGKDASTPVYHNRSLLFYTDQHTSELSSHTERHVHHNNDVTVRDRIPDRRGRHSRPA